MTWDQLSFVFWFWMASSFGLAGLRCLFCYWRNLFRCGERDTVDFITGKTAPRAKLEPLIPASPRDKSGRFISRKAAMNALLRRDVEAK